MVNPGEETATFYVEKSFEVARSLLRRTPGVIKTTLHYTGKALGGGWKLGKKAYHFTGDKLEARREAKASDLYQAYKNGERIYDFTTDKKAIENRFASELSSDEATRLMQVNEIFEIYSKMMNKQGYETRVNSCLTDKGYTLCASTKFPLVEPGTQEFVEKSFNNKKGRSNSISYIDKAQERFETVSQAAFADVENYLNGKERKFLIQDKVAEHLMVAGQEYGISFTPDIDKYGQTTEQEVTCNVLESYDLENAFEKAAVRSLANNAECCDCSKVEVSLEDYLKLRDEGNIRAPERITEEDLGVDKNLEATSAQDVPVKNSPKIEDTSKQYECIGYCNMSNLDEMNRKFKDATHVDGAHKLNAANARVVLYVRHEDHEKLQKDLKDLKLNSYEKKGIQFVNKKRGQVTFDPERFIEQARYIAKTVNENRVFTATKQR